MGRAAREQVRRALSAAAERLPDVFAPGARLVVGYSGGQDSTCLLDGLNRSRLRLDLLAAHVDHALRADSARAAEQVEAAAAAIGVSCEVRRVDVAGYRRGLPAWSVQQAARAARYQVLASVAHSFDARALLVAHTADDQAETVLLNLLRGSGLSGLAGMALDETLHPGELGPPLAEVSSDIQTARSRLVRPLLNVRRATTLAYCAERGLSVIEDASNQSRDYARNRVRLDLLPALERFNPAIREVLARTADLASEDAAALDALVANLFGTIASSQQPGTVEFDMGLWRAQPRALQRRLLRRAIATLVGGLVDVRAAPVEDALRVLRSKTTGQTYHLPYGIELCVRPTTFELRVHGRARRPIRQKRWDAKGPRV
jgi:tRNA(Ile)-lysidine synthase